MKNFITLLFVLISFNSIFSQTVKVYSRLNNFSKEIYIDEIDTVYVILGLEYYNDGIYYFDQYSCNYYGASKYSLEEPNIKFIPKMYEEITITEDSFKTKQVCVYESHIESTELTFVEDENVIDYNKNIVKVFCRIDDGFLGREDNNSKIKMEVLDMTISEYMLHIKEKVKNARKSVGLFYVE